MAALLFPRLGLGLTLGGGIVGAIATSTLGAVVLLLIVTLIFANTINTKKLQRGNERAAHSSGSNESSSGSGIDDGGSLAGKVSAMVLSTSFLERHAILFVYESILRITNQVISLSHADLHTIILLLRLPRMHNNQYKSAGCADSQDAAGPLA